MSWSSWWTALTLPNKLAMSQLSHATCEVARVHFLHAALDVGLLEALSRPRTRQELVDALEAKRPELLDVLLDLGLALGELSVANGRFRLEGRLAAVVAEPEGDAFAAMIQAQVTYYNAVYRQLGTRIRGGELSDDLERIGPLVARISTMTEPFMTGFFRKLVGERGPIRVLDVGCGAGAHLKRCAALNPQLEGQGLEMDESVVRQARQNLERWELSGRFTVVAGDVREPPESLEDSFDLIYLVSMIYYVPNEQRSDLFRRLRERLTSGGSLAIASTCQAGGKDIWAANLDTATRSMTGCASLPDVDELSEQLREAGFHRLDTSRLIPRSSFCAVVGHR
ncbi:MAG: methyltransferase domain-containing protein [Deltaproteobacteria bacterium]|jgi:SAM-dependent methyltransferase|nr:methyltransferase domain-containing protein [Deltaproteobacteria bacterium]MBW2536911.1 methyltransferase domain-containing protein [Deltaproteobacteria bacterium]